MVCSNTRQAIIWTHDGLCCQRMYTSLNELTQIKYFELLIILMNIAFPKWTRCVDIMPTSEVILVTIRYINPTHSCHLLSCMIDSQPFCSMSIGPSIHKIRLFQILTLKIQGQGHGFHQRVTKSAQYPINFPPFHFTSINNSWEQFRKRYLGRKVHQIPKLKCILSHLAVFFAQSIETWCYVENGAVVGAAPTSHLNDQQFYCLIRCAIYWRFDSNISHKSRRANELTHRYDGIFHIPRQWYGFMDR